MGWPTVSKRTVIMALEEVASDPRDRDRVLNFILSRGIVPPCEILVTIGYKSSADAYENGEYVRYLKKGDA
ncbi:MAG: hypothetical protein GY906_24590 [bacterium]|nr:hypothetical protein [bacterium]